MGWLIAAIAGLFKLALLIATILAIAKVFAIARDVDEIKRILLTGRR